jgi:lipoate-protein ligase A
MLLEGLRRLGVAGELVSRGATRPASAAGPCFDTASDGELVVRGRKLVGSAQWREEGAVLQHGSMLIADHRARLAALAPTHTPPVGTPSTPSPPAAALRELLGRAPSPAEVATALAGALDDALAAAGAPRARVLSIDPDTEAAAVALRGRYEDDGWTWRR